MHPALSGFLRAKVLQGASGEARDVWSRAFVDVVGRVADARARRQLHEKRGWFHWHGANSYHALAEAERLGMSVAQAELLQGLGVYAQQVRGFDEARTLYERLAEAGKAAGHAEGEAVAYHQLGRIAQEQRDFSAAEAWYRKSLAISEKQGNEHGAASTYHQLGMIAEEQLDFSAAEAWYRKSLAISEKQGNEHGAAGTYHQLGLIAGEQLDFSAAEAWYRKSLAISEKQGNEHGAAITYAQLGFTAALQEHFEDAGRWLVKCITSFKRSRDLEGVKQAIRNFLLLYQYAPAAEQAKLKDIWQDAGLGELPEDPDPTEST
jgi:tetratricopeptide (TPR) repeat protein